MISVRKELQRLCQSFMFELTSSLQLGHQLRPLPSMLQRWHDKLEATLLDAMMIGRQLERADNEPPPPPTVDELADTKPLKTRPPPPKR